MPIKKVIQQYNNHKTKSPYQWTLQFNTHRFIFNCILYTLCISLSDYSLPLSKRWKHYIQALISDIKQNQPGHDSAYLESKQHCQLCLISLFFLGGNSDKKQMVYLRNETKDRHLSSANLHICIHKCIEIDRDRGRWEKEEMEKWRNREVGSRGRQKVEHLCSLSYIGIEILYKNET